MEYKKLDKTSEYVKVSSKGLERMVKDVSQLKQSLTKVLSINGMSVLHKRIMSLEQEVCKLKIELTKKINEEQFRRRQQSGILYEVEKLREENFQLKNALNVLSQERSEEYGECLSFVTICLTLLWRLSLSDECVTSMLSWKAAIKFVELVTQSLESFLENNKDGTGHHDTSNSKEYALVLSVAGIITNIAATALGREFLTSKETGLHVVKALVLYLSETPAQQCMQVKNLILKAVYNLSISNKGLKYLTSMKGLMTTFGLLLLDETDAELHLSLIKAIQGLVIEPDSASLAHELIEVVSIKKLQEFADLSKGELKKATLEMISDLTVFIQSQP